MKEVRYEIVPPEVMISGLKHTRNDRHSTERLIPAKFTEVPTAYRAERDLSPVQEQGAFRWTQAFHSKQFQPGRW